MHAARYGTRNLPEGAGPVSFFGEDGKVTARSAFGAIHDGLQKPGVVVSSILAGGVKALKAMIARTGYGAPEKAAAFLKAVDLGRGEITLEDLMRQTQADAQGQGKVTQGVLHAEARVGWSTLLRLAGRENAAGERFVTPAELKSFLDGTLFFDLADGNAQRLQDAHWAGQKLTFERL